MCYYIIHEYSGCGHSVTNLACDYKGIPELDFPSRDRCPGKKQIQIKRHESICPECSKLPGTDFREAMKESLNTALSPEDKNRREAMESANAMMSKYHQKLSEVSGPQLSNESLGSVGAPLPTSHEV